MILLLTVALGLAYLTIRIVREELTINDREFRRMVATFARYHHTPDAPAYQHRNPDHHPKHYTRP
jgi:hypothetical protein